MAGLWAQASVPSVPRAPARSGWRRRPACGSSEGRKGRGSEGLASASAHLSGARLAPSFPRGLTARWPRRLRPRISAAAEACVHGRGVFSESLSPGTWASAPIPGFDEDTKGPPYRTACQSHPHGRACPPSPPSPRVGKRHGVVSRLCASSRRGSGAEREAADWHGSELRGTKPAVSVLAV